MVWELSEGERKGCEDRYIICQKPGSGDQSCGRHGKRVIGEFEIWCVRVMMMEMRDMKQKEEIYSVSLPDPGYSNVIQQQFFLLIVNLH